MTVDADDIIKLLPDTLQRSATLRGKEYSWPPRDIPAVIDAGMRANLLNVGGQLQLRLPDATCECCWIQVDTFRAVSENLPWNERVAMAADEALRQFEALSREFDFAAEARNAFPRAISAAVLEDAICFVWYLEPDTTRSTEGKSQP